MILLNQYGDIRSGRMQGFRIKVVHDTEDTGGYYVFYEKDAEGYDDWYPDLQSVENAFMKMDVNWHTE